MSLKRKSNRAGWIPDAKKRDDMMGRKLKIYKTYNDFGKQPPAIEIKIGFGLIPLVKDIYSENKDIPSFMHMEPLMQEIDHCRNQIDEEYGVPVPQIHIRDDRILQPYEYAVLFNGTIIKKTDCKNLQENTAESIGETLKDVITHNFSKIIDQCMVNQMINKVSDKNPDVIDSLLLHESTRMTSLVKNILLMLLEESVSVRDMNTILEAVSDYIFLFNGKTDEMHVSDIVDRVREKLSWQFLGNLADDKKILHCVKLSKKDSEYLYVEKNLIHHPENETKRPCIKWEADMRDEAVMNLKELFEANDKYQPVILCVSDIRNALSNSIKTEIRGVSVISDLEVYECINDYSVEIIGETRFVD